MRNKRVPATAGTLLFRMYGIPARYVSGYVIHPQDLQATDSGSYTNQITDASAHAWTEIYVGKGGWIPVEVTPSASDTTASIPQNQEESSQNQAQLPKPVEKEPEVSPETPGKKSRKRERRSLPKGRKQRAKNAFYCNSLFVHTAPLVASFCSSDTVFCSPSSLAHPLFPEASWLLCRFFL